MEGPEGTLHERAEELAAIEAGLERATSGVGSLLMVEGPAGIGKSALLDMVRSLSASRTALSRHARGGPVERELPFGVARELLAPVLAAASDPERERFLGGGARYAVLALGGPGERPGDPLAPIHGLFWLLVNLAEERPVILIVDDAHWADAPTLRLLYFLARRIRDLPIFAILGVRSGEPDEPAELERLRLEAEIVRPRPLSEAAIAAMVAADLGSRPDPELVAACAEVTAGNPLLLREALRTLRTDGTSQGASVAAAIRELGPKSVARYAVVRLGAFGTDAIALAKAISILGGSPQLRHAAKLAGIDGDQARELCDRLREAEVLAPGRPIQFVHPLVRTAIYRQHREEERSAAHRRAAEVLDAAGASAREIAPHLLSCLPNGDDWVVAKLGEATWDAVSAGAYDAARSYLERALSEPPDDNVPLLHALGRCMLPTDAAGAGDVLMSAAARATDDVVRIRALRDAGLARFLSGDFPGAAEAYGAILEALGGEETEQRLVIEANHHMTAAMGRGIDPQRTRVLEGLVDRSTSSTAGGCHVRQALAIDLCAQCAPVGRVVDLARSFADDVWDLRTTVSMAACRLLAWSGHWDEGAQRIERSLEEAHRRGSPTGVGYLSSLLAEALRAAGRLDDSETRARTAVEIATDTPVTRGNPDREGKVNLISTLLAAGKVETAAALAESTDLSKGAKDQFVVFPWPLETRGVLRLAQGDLGGGADDLLALGEGLESLGVLNPGISSWRQEAVPALAALDRTGEAKQVVAIAEERARAFGASHVLGVVLRARSAVEPRKRQIRTLEGSVAALTEHGAPHELARSLVELGAALRRDGRRSDCRDPLRRALELAHRAGAGGSEERAREELAAAGSRPRSVYRAGVDALTASELRSARLAAEGLTNVEIAQRLFVTRKTVEKHLSNAYMKLEISSRTELPRALAAPTSS